jgi:hypothetical protein
MNNFFRMAAAVPVLALVASAQDAPRRVLRTDIDATTQAKLKAEMDAAMDQMKVVSFTGAAMGPTVKGAPYSAVEISENNQTLADGTRIHNETRTTVYRDSEGRVRRETPNQTTIMDPVAGVSYFLNPKTMTATKSSLTMPVMFKRTLAPPQPGVSVGTAGAVSGATGTFEYRTVDVRNEDGKVSVVVNGKPVDPTDVQYQILHDSVPPPEAMAKMKAEIAATAGVAAAGGMLRTRISSPGQSESLGTQNLEGVTADGTRVTSTLEAGAVGNDRPIQMVNERWYSKDLQMTVMTKHSDPRTGEEIFRVTNINRGEPGADLFQVPASYTLNERK